jgi:GalNAc-alpha-(1->4)-GalNAc-alpha-(1->3)-diNAcBac-PP-undecaprenol alpha-1,4-N-acetyl-D-galactosaminyltransferase
MMQKLKVVCFIGAGLRGGGQERALTSMANYLATIGYQISIISLFKTEQFYDLHKDIIVFWPEITRRKYNRLIYALLIIPYLRKTIKRVKPDLLMSFGEWFNPFVILSTRLLGVPLYVFDRMGPNMKLDPLIATARKALYRFAQGIVVQTKVAANIVAGNSNAKNIIVIPNPVNVINTVTSIKKKQILTIGRLSREKGQIILIEAFSRLSSQEWTLHLVGDGPERTNLESKVSSLGISDKVFFHGHLKDFSNIMGESEIFVLPSFYEGFPNALIEAMSVPLPCISSNCVAGPSEIIEDGTNGLLVEPANVEALVASLNRLIENPVLRTKLATEAYKVRDTLAWDRIYQKYLHPILTNNG